MTHHRLELSLIGAIEELIGRVPSDEEIEARLHRMEAGDGWQEYQWDGETVLRVRLV